MDKIFTVIIGDIVSTFKTIAVEDLTMPLGFGLWGIILMIPLTRVDRRDLISASSYILFCMAAGVTLVFALPQAFTDPPPFRTQIIVSLGMGGVASIRWTIRWDLIFPKESRIQKSFDQEDEEFGRRRATDSQADAKRKKQA